MIEGLSGGINLPTLYFAGTGVDLNTTATNLMRLGIVGAGALGQVGTILSGLSNIVPSTMLSKLGIGSEVNRTIRGEGLNRKQSLKQQVSYSNIVGNSAGDDYVDSVTNQANSEAQKQLDIKKEESTDRTLNDIHEYLVDVFDYKITSITKMLGDLSGYKDDKEK